MAKHILKYMAGSLGVLLLAGCTAGYDMQGVSPVDYYAANPIKNKVVYETDSYQGKFTPKSSWVARDDMDRIRAEMAHRSMSAAQSAVVEFTKTDMQNKARKTSITKLLRSMGYNKGDITFQESQSLAPGALRINVTYAVVVPPNCPDWRTSPVTSYSNTWQGNFFCASETNLGQMVADPNDLVKGPTEMPPELAERSGKVLQDYRAGKDYSGTSQSGGDSGSTTGATAASGATTQGGGQ